MLKVEGSGSTVLLKVPSKDIKTRHRVPLPGAQRGHTTLPQPIWVVLFQDCSMSNFQAVEMEGLLLVDRSCAVVYGGD